MGAPPQASHTRASKFRDMLKCVQRFMVDLHRFVVGVIVRQIGTGHDQRIFIIAPIFPLD
jgi:hypothetical protein